MNQKNNIQNLIKKYHNKELKKEKKLGYAALMIGFDLIIYSILGCCLGLILDKYLHTKTVFTIVLSLIGFLSSLNKIFK